MSKPQKKFLRKVAKTSDRIMAMTAGIGLAFYIGPSMYIDLAEGFNWNPIIIYLFIGFYILVLFEISRFITKSAFYLIRKLKIFKFC